MISVGSDERNEILKDIQRDEKSLRRVRAHRFNALADSCTHEGLAALESENATNTIPSKIVVLKIVFLKTIFLKILVLIVILIVVLAR